MTVAGDGPEDADAAAALGAAALGARAPVASATANTARQSPRLTVPLH